MFLSNLGPYKKGPNVSDNGVSYTKNTVTRKEAFQVSKWLRKNRADIIKRGMSKDDIAKEATTATGIQLSAGNLEGICEDFDIGPVWVTRGNQPRQDFSPSPTAVFLASQLMHLVDEVTALCVALNEKFDTQGKIKRETLQRVVEGEILTQSELV